MRNLTIARADITTALAAHALTESLRQAKASGESAVRSRVASEALYDARLTDPLRARDKATLVDPALAAAILQDAVEIPPSTTSQPALPSQLGPFNTGYIAFDNGVPVGGSMSLTLYQDGGYAFSGSFHDSGFPSYKLEADWVIVSQSGKAFTFSHSGETYGTVDSGSRDFTFSDVGTNDEIKNAWSDLCAAYTWRWTAYCNWDVQAAIDDLINALKVAGTVIAAVIAVVALF